MSGCSCGHHHDHHHHHHDDQPQQGRALPLPQPMVAISGHLTCQDPAQMLLVLDLSPEHVALSRAEPGNLRFDLVQTEDPMRWRLDELFADEAVFALHGARMAGSRWAQESTGIARDLTRSAVMPHLRPEQPRDHEGIAALLRRAFGGEDEAALVAQLRRDGDLTLSMVAEAGGCILGHLALSPLQAEAPALALAPVAVHPALQGRGLGTAMIRAVLAELPDYTVVVLGEPGFYTGVGFAPADLQSPYAGPHLMQCGPGLPRGSAIAHAPAFAAL